tara:strand:+ start:121 stop:537 length:417 start_codon:yes stop_codon:yes gene_type:complete
MAEPVIIGTENKFIKAATNKAMTLYNVTSEPGGTYTALCNTGTTSYQVPVGKTFRILGIDIWGSNTAFANVQLWEHSSAGSAGGTMVFTTQNATDTNAKFSTLPHFQTYIEIATGDYINFYFSESRQYCIIYGVEDDA